MNAITNDLILAVSKFKGNQEIDELLQKCREQITTLNWSTFEALYKPIENKIDTNNEQPHYMFETYGKEWDAVRKADPKKVFTLYDNEDGDLMVATGCHIVNRVGYFITEHPWSLNFVFPYREPDPYTTVIRKLRDLSLLLELGDDKDSYGIMLHTDGGTVELSDIIIYDSEDEESNDYDTVEFIPINDKSILLEQYNLKEINDLEKLESVIKNDLKPYKKVFV